jgi:hypothetical protein
MAGGGENGGFSLSGGDKALDTMLFPRGGLATATQQVLLFGMGGFLRPGRL